MDMEFRIIAEKKDAALREWEDRARKRVRGIALFEKAGRILFLVALAAAVVRVICMVAGLSGEVYYRWMYLAPFLLLIVPIGVWIPGMVMVPGAEKEMKEEQDRLFGASEESLAMDNSYLIRRYAVLGRQHTDRYDLRLIRSLKKSDSGLFVSFRYDGGYDARTETDSTYQAVIPDYYEPGLYDVLMWYYGNEARE